MYACMGGDVDNPGWSRFYETVKAVNVFDLGFDSSEGKKCCVSRAYAVCWVTPKKKCMQHRNKHSWSNYIKNIPEIVKIEV